MGLTEQDFNRLIAAYDDVVTKSDLRITEAEEEIRDAKNEKRNAQERIEAIKEMMITGIISISEFFTPYKKELPTFKKCEFVLREAKMWLTSRSIAELILTHEYGLLHNSETLKQTVNNVGATLKQKVDKGIIFARQEVASDIFYGLAEWFSSDLDAIDYTFSADKYKHVSSIALDMYKKS